MTPARRRTLRRSIRAGMIERLEHLLIRRKPCVGTEGWIDGKSLWNGPEIGEDCETALKRTKAAITKLWPERGKK